MRAMATSQWAQTKLARRGKLVAPRSICRPAARAQENSSSGYNLEEIQEHLESLVVAHQTGMHSMQQYLNARKTRPVQMT